MCGHMIFCFCYMFGLCDILPLVTFSLCYDLFEDYFCEELKFYLSLFPYLCRFDLF